MLFSQKWPRYLAPVVTLYDVYNVQCTMNNVNMCLCQG